MPLNILKSIVHVLNKESNDPLLNDFELDINEDLYDFLRKHISKSLSDDEARKARFKEGKNFIGEVSRRMVSDHEYFVEGSKEIARQLFRSIKTNSSISSTDLVVCLYEADGEIATAILKMDYNTSFIHDIDMVDDKFRITIAKQDFSLPGVNQKIQKCAFISACTNEEGWDLIVLDNQINAKSNEEPVARFFLENFLCAELVMDSRVITKLFKTETENWIRSKSKEGETSVENIREHVNSIIREEEQIDLAEFSKKVFENRHFLQEDYMQSMLEKGIPQEGFSVDREWVDRKLSRIRLKTESGIEISLSYEDYNNSERFAIISNPDGTRSIIIRNITSFVEK